MKTATDVLKSVKTLFHRSRSPRTRSFVFSRPLVLLQSDDWGRVGLRDHEGLGILRDAGIELGKNPYDFYTLETAEDVTALRGLMQGHRDSIGRSACIVANFVMANLNFPRMAAEGFRKIYLCPLTEGFPGNWSRPGLFHAYRQAIAEGVFYPALHGLTHFCQSAVERELAIAGERAALLRTFWQAETPYIYWRMPWAGYEYYRPENPGKGFLTAALQTELIGQAADIFAAFFSRAPISACAPGYRANDVVRMAWANCGVRVAQNGSGTATLPHMDDNGLLALYRTLDFEPAQKEPSLPGCMQLAEDSFSRGAPLIISIHSINFHSSVKDFRGSTLRALDGFLTALEKRYPDLLYVHDEDIQSIVTTGKLASPRDSVSVTVRQLDEA